MTYVLVFVIGAALGVIGGFFGARYYMKKYFQDNPPINEDMLRTMMMQMGQKPSTKKLNQMMAQMKQAQKKSK
ncbi:YneF family protein [Lacticaseibacillus sp. N501-2]|uniref:YneF family protein n=1 Tax=Lacticaseibacillus salsurae TaxID=3367729 RepID=UPI0038B23A12